MHRTFAAALTAAFVAVGITGCTGDSTLPDSPSPESMFDLTSPGTYEGPQIFGDAVVTAVEVSLTEIDATMDSEHIDCLGTVDCETGLPSSDFYRDEFGDVCIGYQWTLCDWEGGNVAQAIALYLPGTTQILDYLMLTEDIAAGYKDPNPGGCYLMTTYVTYSIPGGIHGDFTIDWATAINYGSQCPPLITFCGWPLGQPADPIVVHL